MSTVPAASFYPSLTGKTLSLQRNEFSGYLYMRNSITLCASRDVLLATIGPLLLDGHIYKSQDAILSHR